MLRETLREAEAGGMSQLISRVRVRLDEIDRRLTEPLPPPRVPRRVAMDHAPGDHRQPDGSVGRVHRVLEQAVRSARSPSRMRPPASPTARAGASV